MVKNNKLSPPLIWSNPIHLLAFGFGAGASPYAPGTFGTLIGIPIYLLLLHLVFWQYLGIVFLLFILGVWLCHTTARDLGVHDHPGIVWDEIVGFLVTMTAAPFGWLWIVIGFGLFRLFDILKPWPINVVDKKVSGGLGIMLDDLVAGIFAAAVLKIIVRFYYS